MIKTTKTIVFDLSEVIIRGILGIEDELEPLLNSEKSKIISCFQGNNLRNICKGKISENEYFKKIIDENNWKIPVNEMKRIVRNNFDKEIEGMPEIICKLSESNSLVLYSDHAKEWISYIQEKHPFMQHFKEKVFSFNQNCLKSDKDAFSKLIQLLQCKHTDIIFIDDNIENIRNAENAEIDAILFKNRNELEKVLKEKQKKFKSAPEIEVAGN